MRQPPQPVYQPLTAGLRRMLLVASALVAIAGVQLFVLTEQTARYFAWTVGPPLTAAFLGAAYWASGLLELLAARERLWARARIAVPAVLTFTALTLLATLLHRDRFHFASPAALTRAAAWVWLAVYLAVPPLLGALLLRQLRAPGETPHRERPLPTGILVALAVQAGTLLGFGLTLSVAPRATAPLWPWALTPLTGRAVGAWLLGLGVAAAQACAEDDWGRIGAAMRSYTLLAVLELVALARYPHAIDWAAPGGWLYLAFLVSILAVGLTGWWATRPAPRREGAAVGRRAPAGPAR
jgi:hypothetical protein